MSPYSARQASPASAAPPDRPAPVPRAIDREELDYVVARPEHGPEALVVGKVDEIESMRRLDRAENQPRGVEHRARAVNGVDERRSELREATLPAPRMA